MVAVKYKDLFGNNLTLTDERKRHILSRHPEMEGFIAKVPEVLADPDIIVQSVLDPSTVLYHKKYESYVVVVGKTTGKFIITA